jgi:hypothetical protein
MTPVDVVTARISEDLVAITFLHDERRAGSQEAGWSSEMFGIDVPRSSTVVDRFKFKMDRARIEPLVIGAWILRTGGAADFAWHEHARR